METSMSVSEDMAQARGRRDGMVSSNENTGRRPLSSGEVEGGVGGAWQGPRTLLLQKNSQGFGFTLRHFIVYPPESSLHASLKDEENGNGTGKGCPRSRLEPMDTIFVKSVRDRGPAHQAGLCTGDRLVKVNGESVLGKTYSQVIALIQNSENVLELSIMPKDEDVLQLAYSQDAYLRGNDPYRGVAQSLPDPPPLCYPPRQIDNRPRPQPGPAGSPLDNRSGLSATPTSGWSGGSAGGRGQPNQEVEEEEVDDCGGHYAIPPGRSRARSSSAVSALDFHFANHNAAIANATAMTLPHSLHQQPPAAAPVVPPPRKGSLPAVSFSASSSNRARSDAMCHRALSDWYYSQAAAAERMPPRHRSVSQDGLTELGLGLALGPNPAHSAASDRHRRRETLQLHNQAASPYDGSYWLGGWGGGGRSSCSDGLLAAYAEYEHSYGRSVETLAQATSLVSPRYEQVRSLPRATAVWSHQPPQAPPTSSAEETEHHHHLHQQQHIGNGQQKNSVKFVAVPPGGRQPQQQVAEPQTRRVGEEQLVGYQSYSPSFCRKAGHILQGAQSFRDQPAYATGPRLHWNPTAASGKSGQSEGSEGGVTGSVGIPRPQSTPALLSPEDASDLGAELGGGEDLPPPIPSGQEVVLRQKPPSGRRTPVHALRHPNYASPVDSPEPPGVGVLPSPGTPSTPGTPSSMGSSAGGLGECTPRKVNGTGSLPSHTHDSLSSIPFIGSVKGRRSSYLLAITTERSKSCDEGLNTFREEGRVFSRLPKRVKSFFMDGSLESLRVAEEARSKRHSTSELGTITFSDIRKEGWLHYKQILTEKGKKVGGGMRPWKRVFSVLRIHSLFLYKDKREAVLHGAGAGHHHGYHHHGSGEDEHHPPISIRGCLVDIAYSETRRKHALRLTTQDFCEYLLQAEDRDDMLAWIRVIRENSKTDTEELGFSRQALINKRLNDHRKASPTPNKADTSPKSHRMMPFLLAKTDNSSVNRSSKNDDSKGPWGINLMKKAKKAGNPKAFGARLEDCQPALNNKFVPLIVEMCCGLVESMGLEYTGIYRVPGNNAMVSNLQEQLNKGMEINTTEERWQDLNVISSLLKSFFRKLPEPLFTDDKYNDFIDANRIEDAEDRLKTMKKLIHDLPDHYHHTLKFLVGHLKTIADNSDKNKMEPRNLALVFGPTLVRTSEDNMTDMVTHMPDRYKIVETLILHHDWFFSDGDLDKNAQTPVDKADMQPVPNIDHLLCNIGRPGMPGDISAEPVDQPLRFHQRFT